MYACHWYIVVCYDKLSIQHCLCIENATKLNLKGGFCRNPRNPSGSATELDCKEIFNQRVDHKMEMAIPQDWFLR